MALSAIVHLLACPVCTDPLTEQEGTLRCPAGHAADVARQGYVTLTSGGIPHPGDSAAMLDARTRVQQTGLFDPLTRALVAAVPDDAAALLDVGAGTGHHLAAVLTHHPAAVGIAIDASAAAAKRAARAHQRLGSVRADATHRLPVRDGVIDVALIAFAPRAADELARVLQPSGVVVVATPEAGHLAELRQPLGLLEVDPHKQDRLAEALAPTFDREGAQAVHWTRRITRSQAVDLVAMGPTAFHTAPSELAARGTSLPAELDVTFRVDLSRWSARDDQAEASRASPS